MSGGAAGPLRSGVERETTELVLVEKLLHVAACTRLVPHEGREFEESVLGPSRQQAEDVAQIRPWLDVAESGARERRSEDGVYGAAIVAADEEPVFLRPTASRRSASSLMLLCAPCKGVHSLRGADPAQRVFQTGFRTPRRRERAATVQAQRAPHLGAAHVAATLDD
jgi:hypothetical protein